MAHRSALALESSSASRSKASPRTDPLVCEWGETEAQKGRGQEPRPHGGGRAGAKITPGGKEAAGTGQVTQRAGSCALDLGGQATGCPLPHWPCHSLTPGQPRASLSQPCLESTFCLRKPAACQAFASNLVVGLVLGAWGALFVSQDEALLGAQPGPGTSLKVTAGEGWKSSRPDQRQRDPRAGLAPTLPVLEGIREDCRQVVTFLRSHNTSSRDWTCRPPLALGVALALGQRGLFVSSCPCTGQLRGQKRVDTEGFQGSSWGWTPTPGSALEPPLRGPPRSWPP